MLPQGWRWERLGSVGHWTSGGTPQAGNTKYYGGPIPFVRSGDLNDGLVTEAGLTLTREGLASSSAKMVEPGTLMMAMYGATIGKLGIAGISCSTNQAVAFCRPEAEAVDTGFLFLWLLYSRSDLIKLGQGGAQPNISLGIIRDYPLPVPPLEIQKRAVAAIDTLFAEVAAGEEALATAKASLGQWRQALLKAAVTGELTADWRADNPPAETGEALLQRILSDRRTRWAQEPRNKGKRYQAPVAPETDDLPKLPEGWAWASLDQICGHITSGSRAWSRYYDEGSSVFVMAQNVRPGRYDDRMRQLVGPPANDPERHRTRVARDDLLLTIVGANTGDLCQVKFEPADHYVCQSVALLRPEVGLLGSLVEIFFSTQFGRALQMNRMIYGAGRPHLSFDDIRKLAVPIPPAQEIPAILAAADEALSDGSSSTALKAAAASSTLLRQSILSAAFRGELSA